MPRKVSQDVVDRWIEMADKGLSPWQIKKTLDSSSDVRTIENAVFKVRSERAANEIRSRASVQALIDHWHMLVDSTSVMEELFSNPPSRVGSKRAAYALDETSLSGKGWTARRVTGKGSSSVWAVQSTFLESVESQLLREHTGDSSLWRALDSYVGRLADFIEARLGLARAVERVAGACIQGSTNGSVDLAGVALLDETAFTSITSDADGLADSLQRISLEGDRRLLYVDGALLVSAEQNLPGSIVDFLRTELNGLSGGVEWKGVAATEAALSRSARILGSEISVMRLSPALPGSCRACRPFASVQGS